MEDKRYKLKDMSDSFKDLTKDKPELKEIYEGEDPIYKLRKKILKLRIDKGLSQEELAKRAGTKQSVISRIENGESEPRIETVKKMAESWIEKLKLI